MPIETPIWLLQEAPGRDVVLSCRVRIARNLLSYPFPHRATLEQLEAVADTLLPLLQAHGLGGGGRWCLETLSLAERARLVGARMVSPLFWKASPHRWILTDRDWSVAALVNEEDHLRLQITLAGWQPEGLWQALHDWEERLAPLRDRWAWLPSVGYLTASPANLGSGIRLGLLLHLMGLQRTQQINRWLEALQALGCTTRGLYGEGSLAVEGYLQISLLGKQGPLEDLLARLQGTLLTLIEEERAARATPKEKAILQECQELETTLRYADSVALGTTLRLLAVHRLAALRGLIPADYRTFDHWLFSLAVYPPPEPPHVAYERAQRLRQQLLGAVERSNGSNR